MALIPFDDRDGTIWYDGKLVPWRDAKLHVLTHGLHYGSCVFEGERVYNGKVFELTAHSQRLLDSARLLDIEVPWSLSDINRATEDTIKANNIAEGYVRPVLWRGSEMLAVAAQQTKPHLAIACWVWPDYYTKEKRLQGIRLGLADYRRPAANTAPVKAKAAGLYMICTLSKHKAEREGFDDALMLDYRGLLAECTGANLFLVQNAEIHTPEASGFLAGITRKTVIDLARKKGIKVVERDIAPEELSKTQEVFITGTAAEITPVNEIQGQKFQVGTITRSLIEDYDSLVRGK